MGWFGTGVDREESHSSFNVRNVKIFMLGGSKGKDRENSGAFGGLIQKDVDERRNEMTKLKVYGLDAFQVRAEEEMTQMSRKKKGMLERYLRAHDPTSEVRRMWDLVSIIVIIVSVFAAMFEFAFNVSLEDTTGAATGNLDEGADGTASGAILLDIIFNSTYGIITVFFWLDLVYNFFTAFYNDEGELEFSHYFIARNYIQTCVASAEGGGGEREAGRTPPTPPQESLHAPKLTANCSFLCARFRSRARRYFFLDLISNVPGLIGPWGLLKAFRMHRMSRVLTRWSYLGYDPTKLQIFKLFIMIITIGHMLACLFFMVSVLDFNQQKEAGNW